MMSDGSEPVVRLAELEIDPDQLDTYRSLLREEIEASVKLEPGVLTLFAVALKDSPSSIRILEVYASGEAYASHLTSPHFLKYKALTANMVMSLRLVETMPVALHSKPLG